ncbi:MAG TPA: DNA mismatch repair protein MutS, partial [Syntrophales bacterium]|nr:DNA mismatch repair protein MutS [Syntrophales bacterium]
MTSLTPAMRQYLEIKEKHKDCILFFRMGDFYEMFFEDAVVASKVLEITLTSRNKGKEDSVPLCGVPYHAASSYIAKLIEKGFKVAICEQVEDPREAKGIVRREVVRVITPGLVVDAENLEAKENNFLAEIALRDSLFGLAFIDISTGDFWVMEAEDRDFFLDEVAGHGFREIVLEESLRGGSFQKALCRDLGSCVVNYFPPEYFDPAASEAILRSYFPAETLLRIDAGRHPAMASAAGAVLRYVRETQKEDVGHITDIRWYQQGNALILDENARMNLELFATIQGGRREGTLFHVLDETVTAMGGRRLRWWLNYPLVVPGRIRERLAAVSEVKDEHLARRD